MRSPVRLRGRLAVAAASATALCALLPALAGADPRSLYRGPGPRPGPDILYQSPAVAPELTNAGIWHAPPILVSGTSAYRSGEFLYQDWLYDDHGAHAAYADQNDAQRHPGGSSTSGDIFSLPNGTYTYPTSSAYAGNAADLVELRAKPLADATAFRFTLNSLKDPSLVGISVALGGTPGVALPFPYGAHVSAPADLFLTVHGTSADLRNAVSGSVLDGAIPVTVDKGRRQIEVRIPHHDWNPTAKVERLAAGVGLWDQQNNRYLLPQDNADATHPGGAGGTGPADAAFFNVAFRFEHNNGGPSEEPRPSASDVVAVGTDAPWWRDKAQAHALANHDISAFFANVDFGKLAASTNDDMTDRPEGVPSTGAMDRILSSHFETEQGRDYSSACASAQGCKGELRGQLQPYAIYVPFKTPPATGYGLTLLDHSLSANYNQYFAANNQSQFGERATGSIVITPEGRGPDGWYYDYAGADTFEVWADVAARYHLDPSYTDMSGYSMGGYATYKFTTQYPDLFAKAQPVVGPPGLGVWVPPAPPNPGGSASNTNRMLASVRNVPFLIWNAATDELVPVAGAQAQANTFDSLGYRYEFDLFSPAEHLTLAFNDQYAPAAAFLGSDKVNYNPPHVTYVYNPTMDFPAVGTTAGHAYWVSGIRLRSNSAPAAGAQLGTVDARSEAFGQGDPAPQATRRGGGTLTGGHAPALGYTSQSKAWGPAPATPPRDRLDLRTTNVSEVTIDAARAHLDCNAELNVTGDGPLSTNLTDCPGAAGRLSGAVSLPGGRCSSRRVLTVHVRRVRGARITEITVHIGRRRTTHLRGSDLHGARIDLRRLPKGTFTVRLIVRLRIGKRIRTISLRRTYHTCVPGRRGRHRRRSPRRSAGGRRTRKAIKH